MGRIFFVCVVALLLTACGSEEPETGKGGAGEAGSDVRLVKAEVGRNRSADVPARWTADLVRGNNDFAFEMYRERGGSGNFLFSPYSISLAFSMAYAGARGETASQMAETMNFLPQGEQHPAFNAVESRMSGLGEKGSGSSPPFRLDVANSAWGQEGFGFERPYLETLAGNYGAGLRTVDFGRGEEAAGQINAWIEDETEDRIKDLVSPGVISADTRLVLANAVYFKASWLSPFVESRTRDGSFTLPDGGAVTVPLMRQSSYLPVAEGDGYRAVRLPYKGGAADMLVVVPEKGRFGEIEGRLGAEFLDDVDKEMRPDGFVRLTMPRFDFETDLDLIKPLRAMGMRDPFDGGAANFDGIAKNGGLSIDTAVHRANITVDEKGTAAAAATMMAMPVSATPEPVEVTADRPFFFAITERETGGVLFLGRVTDPRS